MQFRSTTDEMLAARFDPEPWLNRAGEHDSLQPGEKRPNGWVYLPRVECIPSRDPFAWEVVRKDGSAYRVTAPLGSYMRHWNTAEVRFAPRPEYARPEPNPILVAARNDRMGKAYRTSAVAQWWLDAIGQHRQGVPFSILTDQILNRATPAQIDHARKVLTRLANVYKED